jgi:FAD/FMN-containing dehydrogenase
MANIDVTDLKKVVQGEVIVPGDPQYEQASSIFLFSGHPAVVVRVANSNDIVAAIRFARDHQLVLSVRSGGHSGAGLSTNDSGLVIDVTHLDTVEVIDADARIVRVGAGAQWGNVAKELGAHGLAVSSGDTRTVGVSGLTLGGGIGWMVRGHGLALDNVVAIELVTADGQTIRATDSEHSDLFWALRGAGANFGVATAFEFRAEPCAGIVAGTITYNFADLQTVLRGWGDYMRSAPETLNSTLLAMPGFGPSPEPVLMAIVCFEGTDEAAAKTAIDPLRAIAQPVAEDIKPKPYSDMLEDAMHLPFKVQTRSGFITRFDDSVVQTIVDMFAKDEKPVLQIRSIGGAMNRVPAMATAFAHRSYEAFIVMPAFGETMEQAGQKAGELWQPLASHMHGTYVNFLTDVSQENVHTAYPAETYARLAAIKAAYDPDNLFSRNANIVPGEHANVPKH